jgi:tryptophan-rich sensory protein
MTGERLDRGRVTRWSIVFALTILLLGSLSQRVSGTPDANPWYQALVKPALQPPGWAFGLGWTILYTLLGIALAIVVCTRESAPRRAAIGLFVVQLAMNFAWSPLFFRYRLIEESLWLLVALFVAATLTAWQFGRVRAVAGWLLVPYLAWLSFATGLNWKTLELNPDGGPRIHQGAEIAVPAR